MKLLIRSWRTIFQEYNEHILRVDDDINSYVVATAPTRAKLSRCHDNILQR
jgi:hypothetical protein